jgi:hypothetical protein
MSTSSSTGLNECISDCTSFKNSIKKAIKCHSDTAEDIIEMKNKYNIDGLSTIIPNIEKTLLELAGMDNELDDVMKAIQSIQGNTANQNGDVLNGEAFDRLVQEVSQGNYARDLNNHHLVKEFRDLIGGREGEGEEGEDGEMELGDEEEIAVGRITRSLVCPITRILFDEPVKNTACGHTYSRQAVLTHIRARPVGKAKCPVGGCPAVILERNLVDDGEMDRAVRREIRQQQHK